MAKESNKRKFVKLFENAALDREPKKQHKLNDDLENDAGLMQPKPIKSEVKSSRDIITISDDESGERSNTKPTVKSFRKAQYDRVNTLRKTVNNQGALIEELRNIAENLKDELVTWSLRSQQNVASIAALEAKVHDREDEARYAKVDELAQRLEDLEKVAKNRNNYSSFPSDTLGQDPHAAISKTSISSQYVMSSESSSSDRKDLIGLSNGIDNASDSSKRIQTSISFYEAVATQGLGLTGGNHIEQPSLTSNGLEQLLRHLDSTKLDHLKALSELDHRSHSRESILFCDPNTFPMFDVDYMLRGGRTVSYIMDHPSVAIRNRRSALDIAGLSDLRVLELKIKHSSGCENEIPGIQAWKSQNNPPRYVYDLGQLFLRRKGTYKYDLHCTLYNLVVDIGHRKKPVWLVMRPEAKPIVFAPRGKESTSPFPNNTSSLNGVSIARMTDSIDELCLTNRPFDGTHTFVSWGNAQKVVNRTLYQGRIDLLFRTPDYHRMQTEIAARWNEAEYRGFKKSKYAKYR
ncbi:hypothetical protein F4779DRAFT_342253 [Xylariaceae sp. FL0662B]|nr:hypothetical protein F4779DRAFT_342253 [Xylariaceae sp. FL0662B]